MNARAALFHFLLVGAALFFARPLLADDAAKRATLEQEATSSDARKAALALYELGKLDDEELRFASALARYDASLVRDPSHRYALRARTRGDTLRGHSEGDFAPYAELEKLRRDRIAARDPAALDKLVADADGFPPGQVRIEARMLAGDAFLARGDRAKALVLLEKVATDPLVDAILLHQSSHELVDAYLAADDPGSALRIATLPREDPSLAKKVRTWVRRRNLRLVALGVLGLFALGTVAALGRAGRRGEMTAVRASVVRFVPLAIAFAAWTGAVGGVLAASYESGNQTPFIVVAIATLPIVLMARIWSASAGASKPAFRAARGLLSAASIFAMAFVVLASISDGIYLGGFGL